MAAPINVSRVAIAAAIEKIALGTATLYFMMVKTYRLMKKNSLSLADIYPFRLLLLLLVVTGSLTPQRSFAVTNIVVMANFSYTPKNLTNHVGDTVIFTNSGGTHTVSGTGSDPFCGTSTTIATSCTRTFNTVGTFAYQCNTPNHASSGMTGTVTVLAAANTAPTVSITSPTNNAVFAQNASIAINANASDTDGSITNVAFLVGTNLISNDTTSSYSAVTNLLAGTYTLSAVASDNGGAKTTNSVSITVNAPPTLSLNPAGPFTVNENSILSFSVNGTDTDSLTIASTNLPPGATLTGSGNSRTFSWTPIYGRSYASPYSLSFTANDGINSPVTTSSTVSVTAVFTPINVTNILRTGNQFQFHASGLRLTRTNFVQFSSNLPSWISIQTNISTNTAFDFLDTNAVTTRMYRVQELR
ncbi:MAG: large protein [Verrucomicrobiales bacterium]|nr:large protein [Verrucomicrobiales bacterium]